MKEHLLNLYDVAGVLMVAIPIMAIICFCGFLPFKFLLIVIFMLLSVLTIAKCDSNSDLHTQQSKGAWGTFASLVAIICLIWPEMLGLVIGISYFYAKVWVVWKIIE